MHGVPTDFWGKLTRSPVTEEVTGWHPLRDHCADVAAVAEGLLALPIWKQRLGRLAGRDELDQVVIARLCVLAALHDLGKVNFGFQAKGRRELGPTAGHVGEALSALDHPEVCGCLAALNDWSDDAFALLAASICHHGRPLNLVEASASWQSTRWMPGREGLDPKAEIEDLLGRCRAWFPEAFCPGGPAVPVAPEFQHAFAGLIMLADWLASDVRFFPFSESLADDRIASSRSMARRLVSEMGLDVPAACRLDAAERGAFARVAPDGMTPRPAQSAILDLNLDEPGIRVLEAETGSGKTEAALAHFITLFERGSVDGLYFALPTRTAATQIFQRVREAACRAFASPPPVVLAVPGYLRVDDAEGKRLPGFEVLWPDQDRFRFRGWASERPKRYLVGTIVVGTIDQVLLSSLRVNHAHLRATSLLRHLLVVDEVHASDAYMTRIVEDVLGRHLKAGGHALLLSATLGAEARTRLLHPSARKPGPDLDQALATPYPLVSTADSSVEVPHGGAVREVIVETLPHLEDVEAVATLAMASATTGAKVLVIRNTVRDCIETQAAIEKTCRDPVLLFTCRDKVAPHHARYARPDREALDQALVERLGAKRSTGGCVVVATQTVQQSLDLDADYLITDLCPADVLLQRIGRLHRHIRPERTIEARATVLVPSNRDLGVLIGKGGRPKNHHGLGSVYEDLRILKATWCRIKEEPVWRIPTMNRRLVETCLHSTALREIVTTGGPGWREHEIYVVGSDAGMRRQAELNLVDWSKPYIESNYPSEVDERIMTRLGEGDRQVKFAANFIGPFGLPISELNVKAVWARGVPSEEEQATAVASHDGQTRFRFGDKSFLYDRLGLRPDDGPSMREEQHDDDGP
jgi:CRISPR-associated endonuclease/helicase Cas3